MHNAFADADALDIILFLLFFSCCFVGDGVLLFFFGCFLLLVFILFVFFSVVFCW